jgi:hypothetical protein
MAETLLGESDNQSERERERGNYYVVLPANYITPNHKRELTSIYKPRHHTAFAEVNGC